MKINADVVVEVLVDWDGTEHEVIFDPDWDRMMDLDPNDDDFYFNTI